MKYESDAIDESLSELPNDFIESMVGARFAHDFHEMELLGDAWTTVAVPITAPEELKQRVLSAITSFSMNIGFDYYRKRYGDREITGPDQDDIRAVEKLNGVMQLVRSQQKTLQDMTHKGKIRFGIFHARAALIRLQSAFRSASILAMQDHHFECSSICRTILEQMAWAYDIHTSEHIAEIKNKRPSKSIKKLKTVLPTAGIMYGKLTSLHHINFDETLKYVEILDQERFLVRLTTKSESRKLISDLESLANAYADLTRLLHRYSNTLF